MYLPMSAGASRRTRRALLAAVLPAAVAACAIPSAADAATVFDSQGLVNVFDRSLIGGGTVESNDVVVRVEGSFLTVTDRAGITTEHQVSAGTCFRASATQARCPISAVENVSLILADGNDRAEYRAAHPGSVHLGSGNDTVAGGVREGGGGVPVDAVSYFGGPGSDMVIYASASRGVSLTPEDGLANDGRPGDRENVHPDFETFIGSPFGDAPLFGTPNADVMSGGGGNDQLGGGGGGDLFLAVPGDGSDDYHGGPGSDTIDYSAHTRPVLVDLDNVADDSELGENDNVRSNVENVLGGSGNDSIKSLGAFSRLEGRGGDDHLVGGGGPDTVIGGPDLDRIEGGSENDVLEARDGEEDTVICGEGTGDTVIADLSRPTDLITGCESIPVGKLRLAPKAVTAVAGKPARMRLSWRHPRAWRKLRTIELRLHRDGAPVGEVTIRPSAERITAGGGVALARRQHRLAHRGRTVTARLAVRLDDSLAGQTLTAEVEATDTSGRRQLERNAATVRVSE